LISARLVVRQPVPGQNIPIGTATAALDLALQRSANGGSARGYLELFAR
jgi:hypothetical protein